MKNQRQTSDPKESAFNRIELLVFCSAVALLAAVTASGVTSSNTKAERAVCANNLRMIGSAIQSWAGDHGGRVPWRTTIPEGTWPGSSGPVKPGNAWYELLFMSNHLSTPKILACPADLGVRRPRVWGEFLQSSNLRNAVSYTVSLDVIPEAGGAWLSSDRNLVSDGFTSCSAKVNNAERLLARTNAVEWWRNGIVHGAAGHVLVNDGSVEFTSSSRFGELLQTPAFDGNGDAHYLPAR